MYETTTEQEGTDQENGLEKRSFNYTMSTRDSFYFSEDIQVESKRIKRYSMQTVMRELEWLHILSPIRYEAKKKKATADKGYFTLIKDSIYQEYNYIHRNKHHQGSPSLTC